MYPAKPVHPLFQALFADWLARSGALSALPEAPVLQRPSTGALRRFDRVLPAVRRLGRWWSRPAIAPTVRRGQPATGGSSSPNRLA